MSTLEAGIDFIQTDRNSGFKSKGGPRVSDYLVAMEKGNNPNVGPGSYDPIVKPKLNATVTTDWSRQP